jgi:asparagine synthase (glutamine-hydrolysing)
MCGIIGSYGHVPEQARRKACLAGLSHRGPDDSGEFFSPDVWLGHVRLSIIDLAGSRQPFKSRDGRYCLVYNGEIYNYVELREKLRWQGYQFSSDGDTEVLLNMLIAHGPDALCQLDGMFAFVLWDAVEKKLLCARDRMGIKPFYYGVSSGKLSFCSELEVLKRLVKGELALSIDRDALWHYFSTLYIPSPLTVFNELKSLAPGHYLECQAGAVREQRYWQPSFDRAVKDEGALMEELKGALDHSIAIHMRSDVPFGAYLSGGVDSSLMVISMARQCSEKIRTFNVKVRDEELDEERYAAEVSRKCGSEHSVIEVSSVDTSLLARIVGLVGQPFADSSLLPTYLVSRRIRQHVKVALGGDGPDEMFAGYNKYASVSVDSFDKEVVEKSFFRVPKDLKAQLFNDTFIAGREDTFGFMSGHVYNKPRSSFDCLRQLDMRFFMESDILAKVDLMSMAHSLEVRTPFIENKIIDIACSLAPEFMRREGMGKYLLKKILAQDMGMVFATRPKVGFMLPVDKWLAAEVYGLAERFMKDEIIRGLGIFSMNGIKKLYDRYLLGKQDVAVGHAIFAFVVFCLWFEQEREKGYVYHC